MSTDAPVHIRSAGLTAAVSPLGAELQSLVDPDAGELLWQGDPAVWSGRAPLLFPIVGRLVDDTCRLGGRTFRLPQHGFARRRRFEPVAADSGSVTFRLEDDPETRAVYPFAFRLDMTYAVEDRRLSMTARLTNTGDDILPASFGYHPGFAWPLPYGGDRAAHAMVFEAPEPAPVTRPDADGLLLPGGEPSPLEGRRLALSDDLLARGALVFTTLASRGLVYGVEGRRRLAVAFPDTPHLGIWTKPGAGAPYVCIEPWQGHADARGYAGDFRDRPGTIAIGLGEARAFRMTVSVIDP
jgi:galactose mutarotase-like enzyme